MHKKTLMGTPIQAELILHEPTCEFTLKAIGGPLPGTGGGLDLARTQTEELLVLHVTQTTRSPHNSSLCYQRLPYDSNVRKIILLCEGKVISEHSVSPQMSELPPRASEKIFLEIKSAEQTAKITATAGPFPKGGYTWKLWQYRDGGTLFINLDLNWLKGRAKKRREPLVTPKLEEEIRYMQGVTRIVLQKERTTIAVYPLS